MKLSELKYKIKSTIPLIKIPKAMYLKGSEGEDIHSVCLILINVGIGDAIMSTSFIHELKKLNVFVDVIIAKKNIDIFFNSKDIRSIILAENIKLNQVHYDLVIDPYSHCGWFFSYRYFKVLSEMNYSYLSGFNVKVPSRYYDNFIAKNGIHITDYYGHVLKRFFNGRINSQYVVDIPNDEIEKAKLLISNIPKSNLLIAFCPFASTEERSFSYTQVNEVLSELKKINNISIVILCEENKINNIIFGDGVYFYKTSKFLSSAAILSLCDFCISSDTSFVHLANSKNIPLLAFYSSIYNDGFNTDFLCAPNYLKSKQVINSSGIQSIKVSDIVKCVLEEIKKYYDLDGSYK